MERPVLLRSLLRFRECVYYVTFHTAVLEWLTERSLEGKNLLLFTDREYGTSWQGRPGGRLHAHQDKPGVWYSSSDALPGTLYLVWTRGPGYGVPHI